jgi:hypothetical protein
MTSRPSNVSKPYSMIHASSGAGDSLAIETRGELLADLRRSGQATHVLMLIVSIFIYPHLPEFDHRPVKVDFGDTGYIRSVICGRLAYPARNDVRAGHKTRFWQLLDL